MSDCELLKGCLFFDDKLKNMLKASDMMKKMYCKWLYTKYARYKIAIAMGRNAVPKDLFPGDHKRSSEILIQYDMK